MSVRHRLLSVGWLTVALAVPLLAAGCHWPVEERGGIAPVPAPPDYQYLAASAAPPTRDFPAAAAARAVIS